MLFIKDNQSFYHIHIPRTAGRHVSITFLVNGYIPHYHSFDDSMGGIDYPHLHYPLYNFLPKVDDAIKFTVVRDPYTKFLSAVNIIYRERNLDSSFISNLMDKNFLLDFIIDESKHNSFHNNWFRPQNEFISDETLVYKYENGMKDIFYKWLNLNINVNIKVKPQNYPKMPSESDRNYFTLDDSTRENIYEFYRKDCEQFGYEI
jgi:hypothetical protein